MNYFLRFPKFEYYKTLDELPIHNWFKIQETNDLKYLLKHDLKIGKKREAELKGVIEKLKEEYLKIFGLSDDYRSILLLQGQIRAMQIELLLTKNNTLKTFIEIKRHELKRVLSKSSTADIKSVVVQVRKYNCGVLDLKKMSVVEFYAIIQEMKKEIEAKNKLSYE